MSEKHEMTDLEFARLEIAGHLEEITTLFRRKPKLTIICRCDWVPNGDGDIMLTDDDLDAAAGRRWGRGATQNEH